MGELQTEPFQFTFNGFLKVAFQGSRITSDAGLILVRELDERLGLGTLISEHLNDSRQGLNIQSKIYHSPNSNAKKRPAMLTCLMLKQPMMTILLGLSGFPKDNWLMQ